MAGSCCRRVWECWLGLWGGGERCWRHTQWGPQVVQVHLQEQGDSSFTIGEMPLGRSGQCSATLLTSVAHVLQDILCSFCQPVAPTMTNSNTCRVAACMTLHAVHSAAHVWVVGVRCSHLEGSHAVLYAPQVAVGALHHALAQQRCHDSLSGHNHTGLAVRLCCAGNATHGNVALGRHWTPETNACIHSRRMGMSWQAACTQTTKREEKQESSTTMPGNAQGACTAFGSQQLAGH